MEQDLWQQTEELAKRHEESGSLWLKLANDGDRAVVVFLGAPFPRDVCFIDGKYVLFDETLKAAGERPAMRVSFNVALYDTKEVKIFEQGLTFFKDLVRIRHKFGLENWAFEVERHGAAKDPKTTYSILPEHQLTADQQAAFRSLVLHDLQAVYAGEVVGDDLDSYDRGTSAAAAAPAPSVPLASSSTAAAPPASSLPSPGPANPAAAAAPSAPASDGAAMIDESVAASLIARLKPLPRAAVERFCTTFGIARIKELPASQLAKAQALLDALVAEHAPPAPRDPFE